MKYIISYQNLHNHYIDIEFIADKINQDELLIQLPAWRPGRYELGNFAKNIQKWSAFDAQGNILESAKIKKDCWKIKTKGVSQIHIKYNYYAAEINAGSTFLDTTQIYMNPVNCCVYIPERINEACELILQLPLDYQIAIGLKPNTSPTSKEKIFFANNFHELADSPFIASNSLQHQSFICAGVTFNLWFQGECKPDWQKLTSDFTKFVNEQLIMMKAFPAEQYHFLFQILPNKTYHGVEHVTSTVIALGPGYNLMKNDLYADLLGVSSHELFHAWNVKTIRPIEMQPYDYSTENYSRLGYVCEGVTTYYGDYLLFRSGVFNEEQYLKTFADRLQKHFDNFGRFNLSVADSSFDTWLDGYNPGVPNRKTSIYDEGCLLAFVTDIFIRKNSDNKNSLDDVMRYLYSEFALKNKGYSAEDYKGIVEHFSNASYNEIFYNYTNKAVDYEPILIDAMEYIGCELSKNPSGKIHEHGLGIKVSSINGVCKIISVYPNSVADVAGISVNDEILAINKMQIKTEGSGTNFNDWCNYFINDNSREDIISLHLTIASQGIIKELDLIHQHNNYYKIVVMKKSATANKEQKNNFETWSKNKF
jgi:predicted metalloprotease with PDZ domain